MDTLISLTAQYLYLICIMLAVFIWGRLDLPRLRRLAVWGAASGAIAVTVTKLSGAAVSDPRPFVVGHYAPLFAHASDNGFPSDHTVLAALIGFLLVPYSRRFGFLVLFLAVLVGAARVASGIHHIEDIVGGFFIAAISAGAGFAIIKLVRRDFRLDR